MGDIFISGQEINYSEITYEVHDFKNEDDFFVKVIRFLDEGNRDIDTGIIGAEFDCEEGMVAEEAEVNGPLFPPPSPGHVKIIYYYIYGATYYSASGAEKVSVEFVKKSLGEECEVIVGARQGDDELELELDSSDDYEKNAINIIFSENIDPIIDEINDVPIVSSIDDLSDEDEAKLREICGKLFERLQNHE